MLAKKSDSVKIIRNILPLKEGHQPSKPWLALSVEQRKCIELFNKAVLSNEIKFEVVSCLCGCNEFDLIAKYDRYSMLQDTVMCARCGLILSNPRMSEDDYVKFYETDTYRKCYEPFDYLNEYRKRYNIADTKHIFDTILKIRKLDQIKSVMEFGAGGGWNLMIFKEKGINVIGYDYSSKLVALGRERGLDLLQGGIDDINGKFDVIILNHVIEHFTNLINDIKKIKGHLNPDGIFYIAVPNIKNFSMGQIQNAHTYYFTLVTLQYYISHCGLRLIYRQPAEGIHIAAIFGEGKSILKQDFLRANYKEMRRIIRRYYWERCLINIIEAMGLKEVIKFILRR